MSAVLALTEAELLAAWERGLGRGRVQRAVALATATGAPTPWDIPLGRRDTVLLELRKACFGDELEGIADCVRCGEALEVGLTVDELLRGPATSELPFRPLTSRDVAQAEGCGPDARAALVAATVGPDVDVDEGTALLAAADPQADVTVELECVACGHRWSAPFDVAEHVWSETDRWARRLLEDVHTLARAYGWREDDVLAVSPTRRQFYLGAVAG